MWMDPDLQRHSGRYYGKYSGEVTKNEDDDKLGRIIVKVPSIFGKDTEVQARPCLPYGHFFIPAVGTMVWIEFEAGDIRFPIWVGTWYPTGKVPQQAAIKPPDNRVIQTASGHTIEIMDKDGEERITIKHKDNSAISIDKDGTILFKNKDGASLEMKGDTVHITATNIEINGSSVKAGSGAAEPTIMGQTFAKAWNLFLNHVHATAVGPSSPPTPNPALLLLPPEQWLTTEVQVK